MRDDQSILEVLDAVSKRRHERRSFLQYAGAATVAAGGLSLLAACGNNNNDDVPVQTPTPTPTTAAINDADILNFALQLEYLEAQFYSYAVYGVGLNSSLLGGTGTPGAVATGTGAGQPRAVNFTGETLIGQYAREIAADEIAHVAFLRTALGSAAVAQPAINISGDATGAFTAVARAAGIVGANETFDPYSSPDFFLLGAFIYEDVGVTAYKGASPLVANKTYLEAAAGILAAEAYHAGLVRTILYARGQTTSSLITIAGQVSNLRDAADGAPAEDLIRGIGPDDDQGIDSVNGPNGIVANLVPTNSNGLAFSRTPGQVLNIVYGNATTASVSQGAFFPTGVNGTLKASAAK
ncbi:ferritin-like domain-containing protein [Sphingomonas sp.]|uniref:ferritin-like domain-containing protein n=1 Tax=Sphingomonas sp. TaxID=28214 RepID=UPI0035BB9EB3